MIRDLIPGPHDDPASPHGVSMVVTMLERSSLLPHADRFKALRSFDVHLAPVAWSRTWSTWGDSWDESA